MSPFRSHVLSGRIASLLLAATLFLSPGTLTAAPAVTATMDDNTSLATKKNPGATITYTTTIGNSNAVGTTDATGVTFSSTEPDNTMAGTLNATPLALNDLYPFTVLANTSVNTTNSSEFSVVSNDFFGYLNDNLVTASGVTVAVASGPANGSVSLVASGVDVGKFTYTPNPGFTGSDTFTYTISNGVAGGNAASITGTVTIPVGGPVIWYVNPDAVSNGNGTLSSPFNNLASAITAIGMSNNQRIFIYSGVTPIPQSGNFILRSGGWLVGQAAFEDTDNFDELMGISPPGDTAARPDLDDAGVKPIITNSAGDTITLGEGNTILGVAITNTGGAGKFAVVGASINAGTIGNATTSDVTIGSAAMSGGAVSLTGGNGAFNINAPITSTAGRPVLITSRIGGTVAFGSAISGTATGISLTTNTGATITFRGGLSLITTTNAAFTATGGGIVNVCSTADCAGGAAVVNTITTTAATALNITNTTIGGAGSPSGVSRPTAPPTGFFSITPERAASRLRAMAARAHSPRQPALGDVFKAQWARIIRRTASGSISKMLKTCRSPA